MARVLPLVALLAVSARADLVVERWGVGGHVQHPGTLTFASAGAQGTRMTFDLSALPRGARVSVELSEESLPAVASLRITPVENIKKRAPVQRTRIAAVLGADHRFVSSETSEEEEP